MAWETLLARSGRADDDYYDDDDDSGGGDDVETLHDEKAAIFDDYRGKQYRRQRTRRRVVL